MMNQQPGIPMQKPDTEAVPSPPREQPPIEDSTAIGYLTVLTGTGNRAYPLSDARIEIYLPDEEGNLVLYRTQVSDKSGISEAVPIPTPAENESLTPGSRYLPYTTAQVRVFRDGYYSTEAKEVCRLLFESNGLILTRR